MNTTASVRPPSVLPLPWVTISGAVIAVGVFSAGLAVRPQLGLGLVVAAIPAVLVVWLSQRRPEVALATLLMLIPLYTAIFAKGLALGIPPSVLQVGRFWKELLLVGLVVSAVRKGRGAFDWLDWAALAYLAITAVYLVIPIGAPLNVRILAARQDAVFLVVFLAARHLLFRKDPRRWVVTPVLLAGVVMAAFAFMNSFATDAWQQFIQDIGYIPYQLTVLGVSAPAPAVWLGVLGGRVFIRSGSLFLSPLSLSYYMLIPLGLLIGGAAGYRRRLWTIPVAGLIGAGLLLSLTRSAILTVPIMIGLRLLSRRRRAGLLIALIIGALFLWPLADSLGLGPRLLSAFDPTETSTSQHASALVGDVGRLFAHPFGEGLGTSASTAQRYDSAAAITNESWYFQVGTELGLLAMALFVAIVIGTAAQLWQRARAGSNLALGAICGFTAIAVGGLFLHTLDDVSISWSVWLVAGLGSAAGYAAADRRETDSSS